MPKTISFHNGTTWSRGHNIRDERYTDKQEHIDKALSDQNVTVRDLRASGRGVQRQAETL